MKHIKYTRFSKCPVSTEYPNTLNPNCSVAPTELHRLNQTMIQKYESDERS
jgi:hypothetical protein